MTDPAPHRRPAADMADLLAFIEHHRLTDLPAPPHVLLGLALGPGSILDLHDTGGRALVAVLTDACDNAANAAGLTVLACRDPTIAPALMAALLGEAEQAARRGPRGSLELALDPAIHPHEALLRARGFRQRYAMVAMQQRGAGTAAEPAPGWSWADLSPERCDEMQHLVRAAFAGLPGINFPPAAAWRDRALAKTPPDRLLFEGARLAGCVSVHAEPDGSGLVNTLARHPADRDRGLGAVLLTEGLRQLCALGLAPVRLHAAAQNGRAVSLYERHGFVTTEVTPVYALPTPA